MIDPFRVIATQVHNKEVDAATQECDKIIAYIDDMGAKSPIASVRRALAIIVQNLRSNLHHEDN